MIEVLTTFDGISGGGVCISVLLVAQPFRKSQNTNKEITLNV
jgi:hypothetical protein